MWKYGRSCGLFLTSAISLILYNNQRQIKLQNKIYLYICLMQLSYALVKTADPSIVTFKLFTITIHGLRLKSFIGIGSFGNNSSTYQLEWIWTARVYISGQVIFGTSRVRHKRSPPRFRFVYHYTNKTILYLFNYFIFT